MLYKWIAAQVSYAIKTGYFILIDPVLGRGNFGKERNLVENSDNVCKIFCHRIRRTAANMCNISLQK